VRAPRAVAVRKRVGVARPLLAARGVGRRDPVRGAPLRPLRGQPGAPPADRPDVAALLDGRIVPARDVPRAGPGARARLAPAAVAGRRDVPADLSRSPSRTRSIARLGSGKGRRGPRAALYHRRDPLAEPPEL